MPNAELTSLEAQQGERMIEVKIRFWTNDLADGQGQIRPKHAWTSGMIRVERNKSHGISPGPPRPFHSLLDMGAVIEKVLLEYGIKLHPSRRMKKYFDEEVGE
jgi:hypothetical protein